jgi:hypothetical protein
VDPIHAYQLPRQARDARRKASHTLSKHTAIVVWCLSARSVARRAKVCVCPLLQPSVAQQLDAGCNKTVLFLSAFPMFVPSLSW